MKKLGKRQYARMMLQMMRGIENHYSKVFGNLFKRQFREVASLMEKNMRDSVEEAVDRYSEEMYAVLNQLWKKTATAFYIDADKSVELKDVVGDSTFWKEMSRYRILYMAKKVKAVQECTKKILRKIIWLGIRDGKSNRDIAKEIMGKSEILQKYRAVRIARTETHTVAMSAVDSSMKATGLTYEKAWVSVADERTRISHLDAEKIGRISQDKPFHVGGEDLMYPGAPNGSPGNVINCRCVAQYFMIRGGV